MPVEKILWVVNYNHISDFVAHAVAARATAVAIRTDNNMPLAIAEFRARGIKVFGWRWPSANRDAALREADKVATLLNQGLDGYYVDPEGAPGKPYDWDQAGLAPLAEEFCQIVKAAAPAKPLGVTSHYRANKVFARLPWKTFFRYADVLLPQSYWRVAEGVLGHGIPVDNYRAGIAFWKAAGGAPAKIVPMAGELSFAKANEITAYAGEARAQARPMHFYTALASVKPAVWAAIAAA